MNSLEAAIITQDIFKVKKILENDPPAIDYVNEKGVCMALLAAATGNIELVKYIVEYSRASMNIYDNNHRNILHYGTTSGNLEVVKYLVERVGMSPASGDVNLITPYDIAQINGYYEIEDYYEKICGCSIDNMYRNPIRTGMFPDPSIVRVGEDYYMVNSSFIFFPCIPISHSKDLINWKIIGHAITNPEWAMLDELEGGRGFWAPDISYHDGKFYITATYRLNDDGMPYRKQFIVSSTKPEGPYSKPAIIDEDGIDPSIFVDDDGRKYMLLNRGARIFELDKDCTKQISKARLLFYGDNKRAPEGPHLLKKDGYYYLFEAEGGTGPGHRITVSRSRELFGVYEPCPYNPIMRQNDELAGIQRCGHGKPVMTQKGEWFMVYLCGRMVDGKYSILGRETAIDPITWTMDGWPLVNNLKGPSVINKKPNLPRMTVSNSDIYDFSKGEINLDWMYPRPPYENAIGINNNRLEIIGSLYDMYDTNCRSIIIRRQTSFKFDVIAKMIAANPLEGQDGGLTCYYDENTYLKYGIFNINGKNSIGIYEHIGDNYSEFTCIKELDTPEDQQESDKDITIWFKIKTAYLKREFYYSMDGENYNLLKTLDNVYYLCDEGIKKGKRFTGAMVGMYAHSSDKGEYKVAFEFFEYYKDGESSED